MLCYGENTLQSFYTIQLLIYILWVFFLQYVKRQVGKYRSHIGECVVWSYRFGLRTLFYLFYFICSPWCYGKNCKLKKIRSICRSIDWRISHKSRYPTETRCFLLQKEKQRIWGKYANRFALIYLFDCESWLW